MSELGNRGKDSKDDELFGNPKMRSKLMEAVRDLSYLKSRNYADKSSLALVGNHYRLNVRQQKAVLGMSASDAYLDQIFSSQMTVEAIENQIVAIDGFNQIILWESILSNAYIFKGKDGCYRDLSSVHGTYRKVEQTRKAIELLGTGLFDIKAKEVRWYLDRPVSNSGKLKQLILQIAEENKYSWNVNVDFNPDQRLRETEAVVITSDAGILTACRQWFNLTNYRVQNNRLAVPFLINAQDDK